MKMKRDIIGDKFATVSRRQILPVNSFPNMNHKSMRVGKFPAFCQVAFYAAVGALSHAVVVDRRVHRPVVDEHFFHPGGVNLGQVHAVIRVEIHDFAVEADSEFAAVLRFAEFIPPVSRGCCVGSHSYSLGDT